MSLPWPNWSSEEWRKKIGAPRIAAEAPPILAAADSHAPKLSVAFRYAFAKARKTIVRGQKPNVEKIVKAMRAALEEVLPSMLLKAVGSGGQVGAETVQTLRAAGDFRVAKGPIGKIVFTFDAVNKAAVDWAERHAAELIDNITETTRERLNNAIAELIETGDWAEAHDEILDAVGDSDRAELIARHESMLATSEGQRQAWNQAVDEGLMTGREKRVWIVTPDDKLCPICEELDGEVADLDGEYPGGFEGPPAHVACRCTEGIA